MALNKYKARLLMDYKDDRLVLVDNVLEESFYNEEHADKKVALISIQGTSRLGKSQLMQLLALHLLLEKNKDMDVMHPYLDSFDIIGSDDEEADEDGNAQKQPSKKSAIQCLKDKAIPLLTRQQKKNAPKVGEEGHSSVYDADIVSKQQQLQELFFEWKRGNDRHTRGIWISGPYMLKDADNDEVACFLMDSQGSNDRTNTWCIISVFNQLITSTLIQNMHRDIDDTETEFFNIFREIAEFVKNQQLVGEFEAEKPKPEIVRKTFQQLLLLVRDWEYPDEIDFGLSGGQQLMGKFVENMSLDGGKKVVCDQLFGSFDNVETCLMPDPGKYLRGLKNPEEMCLDKVSPAFMAVVKELAESLFNPGKLILKQDTTGQPMTCKQMGSLIEAYNLLLKETKASAVSPAQMRASMKLMQIVSQIKDEHLDALSSVHSADQLVSKQEELLVNATHKLEKILKELGMGIDGQQEEMAKLKNGLQKMFECIQKKHQVQSPSTEESTSEEEDQKPIVVWKEANTAFWQGYTGHLLGVTLIGGFAGAGATIPLVLLVLAAVISTPTLPVIPVIASFGLIVGSGAVLGASGAVIGAVIEAAQKNIKEN